MTAHDHHGAREDRGEHTPDGPLEGDYIICWVNEDEEFRGYLVDEVGAGLLGLFDDEEEAWEQIRADARRDLGDYCVWYAEDDGRLPSLASTEQIAEDSDES